MASNAERQARWRERRNLRLGKEPNMIRCLVKGDRPEALNELVHRHIDLSTVVTVLEMENETFLDVPSEHEEKLVRWFCEPSQCEQGKGFPPGTLLFYSRGKE